MHSGMRQSNEKIHCMGVRVGEEEGGTDWQEGMRAYLVVQRMLLPQPHGYWVPGNGQPVLCHPVVARAAQEQQEQQWDAAHIPAARRTTPRAARWTQRAQGVAGRAHNRTKRQKRALGGSWSIGRKVGALGGSWDARQPADTAQSTHSKSRKKKARG